MTTQPVTGGLAKGPHPLLLPRLLPSLTSSISSIWSPQILPRVAAEAEKSTREPQLKSQCGLSHLWGQGLFCFSFSFFVYKTGKSVVTYPGRRGRYAKGRAQTEAGEMNKWKAVRLLLLL